MLFLWGALAALVAIAGTRHLLRLRASNTPDGTPRVDDEALRRILETGSLPGSDDGRLDMDAAARAEEEFWRESWDEPEEYGR